MFAFAVLMGYAAYSFLYAGVTGRCWESPWCPTLRAAGHECHCAVPEGAVHIAEEILGIGVAFELLRAGANAAGGLVKGAGQGAGIGIGAWFSRLLGGAGAEAEAAAPLAAG